MPGPPLAEPSPLLVAQLARHGERVPGPALDVACGRGRHALATARAGIPTLAVDRDATARATLRAEAQRGGLPLLAVRADLEAPGTGLPVAPARFSLVLVFRYLHRPLFHELTDCLAPGGLLLYETFTVRQRDLGYGPGNPAFLLQPGELEQAFPALDVRHYEEGRFGDEAGSGRPLELARLVARRPAA